MAGMSLREQVHHVEAILTEAGMVGRPSLDKCKAIKAKRELDEELASINPAAILGGRRTRHGGPAVPSAPTGADGQSNSDSDNDTDSTSGTDDDGSPVATRKRRHRHRRVENDSGGSGSDT